MTNTTRQPCAQALDVDCYKAHPAWARQAFAYRLIHLLTPAEITRRLPKALRLALIAPGVDIPPGVTIPDGAVVAPGAVIPPGWTAPEPDPGPIVVDPAAPSPPDVAPSPWITWSMFPPISLAPALQGTGITPPLFVAPWDAGPPTPPGIHPTTGEVFTITAETSDGYIQKAGPVWATVQGAGAGDAVKKTYAYSDRGAGAVHKTVGDLYILYRSFFMFDLSAVPSSKTVKTATLRFLCNVRYDSDVVVQQGTQGGGLSTADFDAFLPTPFGLKTWGAGYQDIPLNTAGVAHVQSALGSTAYFCCREYTHDYLNAPPPDASEFYNGLHYANDGTPANRPQLIIGA